MLPQSRGSTLETRAGSMTNESDRPEPRPSDDWTPSSTAEPPIEVSGGLSHEQMSAVTPGSLRSPIMAVPPPPVHPFGAPMLDFDVDLRLLARNGVVVLAVAAPFVAVGQVGLGLAAAVCTSGVLLMRRVGRGVAFGFGDGFVSYRSAPGWPRGVQEEYDVRWGSAGRRPTANQT